tara:strand:+ start:851 stop:3223 length:2373 start_codon:yes stop_codon:yes gene_type:complete
MIKKKPQLQEEIQKMDYFLGYNKDFSYNDVQNYTKKKTIKESKKLIKTDTKTNRGNLHEWAAAVRVLGTIGSKLLPQAAKLGRFGARTGSKIPGKGKASNFIKSLFGFGKVNTKGLKQATGLADDVLTKVAAGSKNLGTGLMTGSAARSIMKKEAIAGLWNILGWGFGLNILANWGSEGESAVEAAGAMEAWGSGEGEDSTNKMTLAFSPVFYKETNEGSLKNEVNVTFMDKGTIIKLANVIHDATEGGEKYYGKGAVDWAVGGIADFVGAGDAIRGAGTEEEEINRALRACTTIVDISHLSDVYETKYDTPLIVELGDELEESELLDIQQIVVDKPLAIINGKRIFNPEDLNEEMEGLAKDMIKKPEGLPKFRTRFNSLFDGKMVDVWVKRSSSIALVFVADKFVGEFQYIRSSGKVYFKPVGEGPMTITDKKDENQVMKIFGAAEDEEQAGNDLGTLSRSISVGSKTYTAGTSLKNIEGPNGSADEYLDQLKKDNPTVARRKPTAIQGAAIALTMGEKDYRIIQESITDLRSVLGESRLLEQQYSVTFDRGNNKYRITRFSNPTGETNAQTTTKYTPSMSIQDVAAGRGTIRKGEKGDALVLVQSFLKMPTPSGVYDDETFSRVVSFQSQNNIIPANGVIGPETALAIIKAMNVRQPNKTTLSKTQQRTPKKQTEKKIKKVAGRYASEEEAQDALKNVRHLEDTEVDPETCVEVITTASRALPARGEAATYKVLQFCYDKYNFGGLKVRDEANNVVLTIDKEIRSASRKVKREYGITGKGDRRNRKRR